MYQSKKVIDKLEEVFDKKFLKRIESRERIEGESEISYNNNMLFVCEDTDKVNSDIKSYLNDKGLNVITVSPNGYEIQREKATIQLSAGLRVFTVLYPGDKMTDELKRENTVLFLPDLDQMSDLLYRRLLFDVIRTHIVAEPRNGEGGFTKLHHSFTAIATVSNKMPKNEFFVLCTKDAEDCFRVAKTY